jgi:uncharacterized membrane protein YphA (DoxX/SURF4 family)
MKVPKHIKLLFSLLLILIGWHLLFEGAVKLMDPGWSSVSYLEKATGPIAPVFKAMATSPFLIKIIDFINIYGQVFLGLLLMTGLFVRFAAIGSAILLFTYYISSPPLSATAIGYAMEGHYFIVNKNLIEAFILLTLAFFPKNWFYGLQHIKLKMPERSEHANSVRKQVVSSGGYPLNRREMLANFIWTPFLAGLVLLIFRTKNKGLDAITGATEAMELEFIPREVKDQEKVYPPNEPMGIAKGLYPGRVSWVWDPESTNPDCENRTTETGRFDEEKDDAWFLDRNTNQAVVDKMVADGIRSITGKRNLNKAWDTIFRHNNSQRGKGDISYKDGEKIFLKINRTSAAWGWNDDYSRLDQIDTLCCETSPQFTLSILRQLVNEAGVPEEAIYVGDPMTGVYKDEYEKYFADFPGVNYLARTGNMKGRTPVLEGSKDMIFYSDKMEIMKRAGKDRFYDVLENAEYILSLAGMKGHDATGISLCTKNHFGTQSRPKALHLHQGLNVLRIDGIRTTKPYGNYRVLTDLMGCKYIKDKSLLYMLDALWIGYAWNGFPVKLHMSPFDNHWSSSVFFSLDPVAIESVAFDFLRTEFSLPEHNIPYIAAEGTDEYLHHASNSETWPEGIVYSPDGDGKILPSLGVHEHWNNAAEKKYSRNLGTGEGIELIKILQG